MKAGPFHLERRQLELGRHQYYETYFNMITHHRQGTYFTFPGLNIQILSDAVTGAMLGTC